MLRLSIVVLVVTLTYAVIDFSMNIHVPPFIYISFLLLAYVTHTLSRYNRTHLAKLFGLVFFNAFIFLVASSEPFETGMHLHFVTVGTVAMALYGYDKLPYSIFFVASSFTLFMSVYLEWYSPEFIVYRNVTETEARFFFTSNTIIAASISSYVFLMYARLSYQSEQSLLRNERIVKNQNSQLLKSNEELDKLVFTISHDLRSPLASILGLVHLAELSNNNNELKEYCHLIKQRVESLNGFISKTIHHVRNEKLGIERIPVKLYDCIEDVIKNVTYQNGANEIEFQLEVDPNLVIQSDPVALEIILNNLLSNAVKYRDRKRNNPFVRISANQTNGSSLLAVEDNGVGIESERLENIFNKFYRGNVEGEGSGLGLFIVKDAVDKLGGKIAVTSNFGSGTKFVLTIGA